MNAVEEIPVYICRRNKKTQCICKAPNKRCNSKHCFLDTVSRDRFKDLGRTILQNKYGKC